MAKTEAKKRQDNWYKYQFYVECLRRNSEYIQEFNDIFRLSITPYGVPDDQARDVFYEIWSLRPEDDPPIPDERPSLEEIANRPAPDKFELPDYSSSASHALRQKRTSGIAVQKALKTIQPYLEGVLTLIYVPEGSPETVYKDYLTSGHSKTEVGRWFEKFLKRSNYYQQAVKPHPKGKGCRWRKVENFLYLRAYDLKQADKSNQEIGKEFWPNLSEKHSAKRASDACEKGKKFVLTTPFKWLGD